MTVMDVPAAPERSLQQRMDALAKANDIRTYRRKLKVDIKAGKRSVEDLLTDPPPKIETMKVYDLLLAAPKYGRVKTLKTLNVCRISPSKTVGGLSPRQRGELVGTMRGLPVKRNVYAGSARW